MGNFLLGIIFAVLFLSSKFSRTSIFKSPQSNRFFGGVSNSKIVYGQCCSAVASSGVLSSMYYPTTTSVSFDRDGLCMGSAGYICPHEFHLIWSSFGVWYILKVVVGNSTFSRSSYVAIG